MFFGVYNYTIVDQAAVVIVDIYADVDVDVVYVVNVNAEVDSRH